MRVRRSQTGHAASVPTPNATDGVKSRRAPARTIDCEARFADAMTALGFDAPPKRIALAFSGGGDSVALLHLLGNWAVRNCGEGESLSLHALIVDHGLREGSDRDAKRAASLARKAEWHAHILKWTDEKPKSNIEEAARNARYSLLGQWCAAHKARALFVAHTRDDLTETFLLRLGRGSGVYGLSAMRSRAPFPVAGFADILVYRPLLDFERAELRAYLETFGARWLEDPMNADPRFSRVRVRALMPLLEEAGVSQKRIADAAHHLARARAALDAQVELFLTKYSRSEDGGVLVFDAGALMRAPSEIGLRALSALLNRATGNAFRPRFERLEALYGALSAALGPKAHFRARTLGGCRIGLAPKRAQAFGPATFEIKPEKPRKTRR